MVGCGRLVGWVDEVACCDGSLQQSKGAQVVIGFDHSTSESMVGCCEHLGLMTAARQSV